MREIWFVKFWFCFWKFGISEIGKFRENRGNSKFHVKLFRENEIQFWKICDFPNFAFGNFGFCLGIFGFCDQIPKSSFGNFCVSALRMFGFCSAVLVLLGVFWVSATPGAGACAGQRAPRGLSVSRGRVRAVVLCRSRLFRGAAPLTPPAGLFFCCTLRFKVLIR